MEICYSTNERFVVHTAVSITSLLKNNALHEIAIHILHSDLSSETIARLSSFVNQYNKAKIIFHKIDAMKFDKFDLTISHITKETYFRYLIPELLVDIDKVLYIDGDTIINADISELFEIDLSGYYCAGVSDIWIEKSEYKNTIGLDGLYVNAGVLLLNIGKLRIDNIVEKLFKLTLYGKYKNQDQDVINVVFNGKIKELDCIYNFKRDHEKKYPHKFINAKIIHYVGPNKPWKRYSFYCLKRLYYKYEKLSPLYIQQNKFGRILKNIFSIFVRQKHGF